jgi:ABC-2 type transport system permease protein
VQANRALARRAFADGRVRTYVFAAGFALVAYGQAAAYRTAYATPEARLGFARSFAGNKAIRLFYGLPHDLLTVGGYTAWRVGGVLAILAAVWGVLAAVRARRTEEDAGRAEVVLATPVGRGAAFAAALAAIGAGVAVLGLALFLGLVAASLPVAGSALLALAVALVAAVFAGIGAVAAELAPTRRVATALGMGAVAVAFLLRAVADTASGAGWLRWATPLGWAEEVRAFTGARPAALALPAAATALPAVAVWRMSRVRDVGTGLLRTSDATPPRLGLLSSPLAHALREERGTLLAWLAGLAFFAAVMGVVSASISSAGVPVSLRRELAKLGVSSILTPAGYLGFVFLLFVLVVALFCCAQLGAARQAEADGQLETTLALPIGRVRWLGGRLVLAVAGAGVLGVSAGVVAWLGAVSQGVDLSLLKMLEAGANCLPTAVLFLGWSALAYALVPRATAALGYGLVAATFLWWLLGALLGAPHWLVDLTPFAHVGAVPGGSLRVGAASVMVAAGAAGAALALVAFRRRDLVA